MNFEKFYNYIIKYKNYKLNKKKTFNFIKNIISEFILQFI